MCAGVHALPENVVAKLEHVTCDEKSKIWACLGEDVVWLCVSQ